MSKLNDILTDKDHMLKIYGHPATEAYVAEWTAEFSDSTDDPDCDCFMDWDDYPRTFGTGITPDDAVKNLMVLLKRSKEQHE
jgi:hypothetical protein